MTQDPFDPYPTGIKEIELATLHANLIDRMFSMIVADDAVAEMNTMIAEALDLSLPFTFTDEDGKFDAETWITVTDFKLKQLQRLVQEVQMRYVADPWPIKRLSSKNGDVNPMMIDNVRKWLKQYEFTLAEVRTRHANADPASRQYGIAGRPAAFGTSAPFDLDDLDLSEFTED